MKNTIAFALCVFILAVGGCGKKEEAKAGKAGVPEGEEAAVKTSYDEYRKAVLAKDVEGVKRQLTKENAEKIGAAGDDAKMALAMISGMMPKEIIVKSVAVDNGIALIVASGRDESGGVAEGKVNMVREGGRWRVQSEHWGVSLQAGGTGPPVASGGTPGATSKPDLATAQGAGRIRGKWYGQEHPGGGAWIFLFGENNEVSARGESGEWYSGTITVKNDIDGGRPPSVGSVLDIEITGSSDKTAVGSVSVGAWHIDGETLYVCSGKPGGKKRFFDWSNIPDEFRCFSMSKAQKKP